MGVILHREFNFGFVLWKGTSDRRERHLKCRWSGSTNGVKKKKPTTNQQSRSASLAASIDVPRVEEAGDNNTRIVTSSRTPAVSLTSPPLPQMGEHQGFLRSEDPRGCVVPSSSPNAVQGQHSGESRRVSASKEGCISITTGAVGKEVWPMRTRRPPSPKIAESRDHVVT